MSVKIVQTKEVVTAYLEGEIDHHTAAEMRNEIDKAVQEMHPTMLVLDFKDVSFMDSSGIGLVMGRYKTISSEGGELAIINTSPQIKGIFLCSLIKLRYGIRYFSLMKNNLSLSNLLGSSVSLLKADKNLLLFI
jgi:stage II sporulation protein AA (anti-sigma F factor antagonist)